VFCKLLLIQHYYKIEFGLGSLEQNGLSLQAAVFYYINEMNIIVSAIPFLKNCSSCRLLILRRKCIHFLGKVCIHPICKHRFDPG